MRAKEREVAGFYQPLINIWGQSGTSESGLDPETSPSPSAIFLTAALGPLISVRWSKCPREKFGSVISAEEKQPENKKMGTSVNCRPVGVACGCGLWVWP